MSSITAVITRAADYWSFSGSNTAFVSIFVVIATHLWWEGVSNTEVASNSDTFFIASHFGVFAAPVITEEF